MEHLKLTVDSLLPQVDEVHVMLNGHQEVPSFLKDRRKVFSERMRDLLKMFGRRIPKRSTADGNGMPWASGR